MQRTETWVAYAERPNGDVVVVDVCDDWELAQAGPVYEKNSRVDELALANLFEKALERVARTNGLRNSSRSSGRTIDHLLTVKSLAAKLDVSLKTVRSWIYLRKIPFTKVGRRVYFAVDVVEQLLSRNAVAA